MIKIEKANIMTNTWGKTKTETKTRPFSLTISDPNPVLFENFNLKSSLYFVLALNPPLLPLTMFPSFETGC